MSVQKRSGLLLEWDRVTFRARRLWDSVRPTSSLPLHEQFPWSSPNIWREVVDAYTGIATPSVFEYSAGVSSLWHIRNLLKLNGSYSAVEHKSDWYGLVLNSIVAWATLQRANVEQSTESNGRQRDAQLSIALEGQTCTVRLFLRPTDLERITEDGTAEQFASYVSALEEPRDVVVDGRARVACVNHALGKSLVKPGGLLALFEAGRGQEGWLRHPAVPGYDYTSAVSAMRKMGGRMADGDGLDSWPDQQERRAGVNAYYYPAEACFLELPRA